MTELVNVVAVQIKAPHAMRVMARNLTPKNAEAFIKLAVMRRGVDEEFYTTEPATPANSEGRK